jgi:hypothetical protein
MLHGAVVPQLKAWPSANAIPGLFLPFDKASFVLGYYYYFIL